MRLRILETWRRIRTSFWFLPALMVASTIALAFTMLLIDRTYGGSHEGPLPWLTVAGAASARSLLSTIAGSMITVAGVTFSIVIVALTMASSQFSPRLLTDFMEDTGNQVVLGTFISVFLYCLVVLIHLPGNMGSRHLPQSALLGAEILAVVAVAVLIFFFHHISDSIRAGEVVRHAGLTLDRVIDDSLTQDAIDEEPAWPPSGFSEATAQVAAPRSAYLSAIDRGRLVDLANEHGLRIMIAPRAGDFLLEGQSLARVKPADALTDEIGKGICEACSLFDRRDDATDLPLAVERLTEVAVRSLSPGINDPYTALAVIHRLTSGLDKILEKLPAPATIPGTQDPADLYFRQADGAVLLERVVGPLRTYGRQDARILEALVDSLRLLSRRRRARWNDMLLSQVDRVRAIAKTSLLLENERERLDNQCSQASSYMKEQCL